MFPLGPHCGVLLATATLPSLGSGGVVGDTIALSLAFGAVVGFTLGLTGGGGSIFAVPLLVYGLGMPAREAMGISLAAVGATALFGMLHRLKNGEVEVRTGALFSVAGMLGAPVGTWIRGRTPEVLLLVLFAVVMLLVAARMWRKAVETGREARALVEPAPRDEPGPTCQRDPEGRLLLTSRCAGLLGLVGLGTGILSGLFGVGGGFVIVPALVFYSGMGIHRAVATSLLVISLISVSGVGAHVLSGRPLDLEVTGWFLAGGVGGMVIGTRAGRRLSGTKLQKVFAAATVTVALYMIIKNLAGV